MAVQLSTLVRSGCRHRMLSAASVLTAACIASPSAFAAATPSAMLSTLTPGEFWTWSLSGSVTQPASGQVPGSAAPLSGTMFENVEVLPFQGSPTLALVSTDSLTVGGVSIFGDQVPPQGIFYIQQDPATYDVLVVGDNQGPNGTLRVAAGPAEFIPGAWSLSTSYANTLSFPAGDATTLNLSVTGTTIVTTPLGDFAAWVAPNEAVDSTGVVHAGTDYWTPELGAPALFNATTTAPDGGVTEITATLTGASIFSTPVPEPATLAVLGCGLLGLVGARWRRWASNASDRETMRDGHMPLS